MFPGRILNPFVIMHPFHTLYVEPFAASIITDAIVIRGDFGFTNNQGG